MQRRVIVAAFVTMAFACGLTPAFSQPPPYPFSEMIPAQSSRVSCLDTSRIQELWSENGCTAWATECGDLIEYVPSDVAENPRLVVVVHGSIGENEVALETAKMHIMRTRWHRFADQQGYILVAPAFDRRRYGGYRHLRGADEFVLRIAETYAEIFGMRDSRFYLYGHSAGGQFAHRFLVTFPHRLLGAVMSAPGNYANPVRSISWPYGIGDAPNPLGFVECATVPSAVVVGALDTEESGMGGANQFARNRVERARNWVTGMQELAARVGAESLLELIIVPGIEHSSSGTLDMCAAEFKRIFDFNRRRQSR